MARSWGALAVGAGVVALGLAILSGVGGIAADASYAGVGPRAFPILVGLGLVPAGIGFLVSAWRGEVTVVDPPRSRAPMGWIGGGLGLATALLPWLGFVLVVAALFAMTARGFGSRRWLRSLLLGFALGVLIYVAFARGLGVSLPGGPLDLL
jgi:putative tricarboxylic transport membrane protein